MLDIGFSELLLIAVAALIFVGPKDLPVVVRHITRFLNEIRGVYAGLKGQMQQVVDELGVNEMRQNMTTIIDLEGKPQQAFDVRELDSLRQAPPLTPPPNGGRLGGGRVEPLSPATPPLTPEPEPAPPQTSPAGGGSKSGTKP
jgi:sec-independent protein translocase protein TatB